MKEKDITGKKIHFIGVGGIGMSGIACLLAEKGYQVSGTDIAENDNIKRLRDCGICVHVGHDAEYVKDKDIIVVSTGIKKDNAEYVEAERRNLPILHRSEMLAIMMESSTNIAISGTHGKTTTTALMGWVIDQAGFEPTVVNGGIMNAWGSNLKLGKDDRYVVEADESDGSFVNIPRKFAVVTNMDPEHMDFYKTFDTLFDCFKTFSTTLADGGVAVLGIDHPHVYALWKKIQNRQPCVTFGIHSEADVQARNINFFGHGTEFDLCFKGQQIPIQLPLYGHYNVINALAVAATALECGVQPEIMQKAFQSFQGVQRRFTKVGMWNGATIIDDYAHHPVEIRATLKAAKRAAQGNIIAVLQPHRYSRLTNHFQDYTTCCEDADVTIVLPVYAAGENVGENKTHQDLVSTMKGEIYNCENAEDLPLMLQDHMNKGDMVVCLGAGSISKMAYSLETQLKQINSLQCA